MRTHHRTRIAVLSAFLFIFGILLPNYSSAATAKEIDAAVKETMKRFKKDVPGAEEYLKIAKGILVIPKVFKAGFIIGGEYGEGALLIGKKTVDYYSLASASFGLQLGAQKKDIVLIFVQETALKKFQDSTGFKVGVDGSVAITDVGDGASIDTATIQDPIIGFILGQKGLMANLTLEGSKITKLESKKKK